MSLLEVSHLRKSYGKLTAVDDLSFRVEAGEVFGLLGPNGAGKSTTMMMLAGLVRPDGGTIALDGQALDYANREARTALGVVPQDLAIYPDLTARENLKFFGRLYGLRDGRLDERIETVLGQTGLAPRADDLAGTFSGGMKRRLNFGIGLLHEPRFLILDEPTVGVDPQSRSHLLDCVRELSAAGIGVLYASHYMEEVQGICHRVAIIDHGKLLACDTVQALLSRLRPELCLRIAPPANGLLKKLKGLAEVRGTSNGETTLVVPRDEANGQRLDATLARILEALSQSHVELHAIETEEPNLERLFLQLTGHSLRD